MRLHEARKDLYRRLAKEQGYKSRAAFKLIEAADKYGFLREGGLVVDFGSAPGGWLQVASQMVGERGKVVGIDLKELHLKETNVATIASDVNDLKISEKILTLLGERKADAFLSDIAPTVSGVWELDQIRQVDLTFRVLDLAEILLRKDGAGFLKLFEGERSEEVRGAFRVRFRKVHAMKPAASRSASSELYYYCEGWKGRPA